MGAALSVPPEQICSICLDFQHDKFFNDLNCLYKNIWSDESVCTLLCNHLFHNKCIVDWLKAHSTCPLCNKSATLQDLNSEYLGTFCEKLKFGNIFIVRQPAFNQIWQLGRICGGLTVLYLKDRPNWNELIENKHLVPIREYDEDLYYQTVRNFPRMRKIRCSDSLNKLYIDEGPDVYYLK